MTRPRGLRRQARAIAGIPPRIIRVLGVGTAFNHFSDAWLKEKRRHYGERLRVLWMQEFGHPPFVDDIAQREGWDDE